MGSIHEESSHTDPNCEYKADGVQDFNCHMDTGHEKKVISVNSVTDAKERLGSGDQRVIQKRHCMNQRPNLNWLELENKAVIWRNKFWNWPATVVLAARARGKNAVNKVAQQAWQKLPQLSWQPLPQPGGQLSTTSGHLWQNCLNYLPLTPGVNIPTKNLYLFPDGIFTMC